MPWQAPERRAAAVEIRAKGRRLDGYAALFGVEARIGDVRETIAPGAFTRTLATGHDVLALAERGDLGGMSFGFTVAPGGDRRDSGDTRELRAVTLHEISVVQAWPAYDGTSVAARSLDARMGRLEHARRYLQLASLGL